MLITLPILMINMMVAVGSRAGTSMWIILCHLLAPSIVAASYRVGSTEESVAI